MYPVPPLDIQRKDFRLNGIDVVLAGELILKLRAMDALLCSTPRDQRHELDYAAIALYGTSTQFPVDADALHGIQVMVKDLCLPVLIPALFVDLYMAALDGRAYHNVYRPQDSRTFSLSTSELSGPYVL